MLNKTLVSSQEPPSESSSELSKISVPFTLYDAGWVILCMGMAIGVGIVFMPVQIGLKGLWVFIATVIIAYPAVYFLQKLYLETLSQTDDCEDYVNIITQYLGKNWGMLLGVIYFCLLLHGISVYSLTIVFDSAAYIQAFNLSEGLLSDYAWYPLIVLGIVIAIASQGEKLLFKVSGPMITINVLILIALSISIIPYWNFANIKAFPDLVPFVRDVVLTLPFTLFSILFVTLLNPMNIAYRKIESNPIIANYRAMRVTKIAYMILVVVVLFFALSFTLMLSYEQAVSAFEQNISALAILNQITPEPTIMLMTVLSNVFTIFAAFCSMYLGFQDAILGLVMSIITRFIPKERINRKMLNLVVTCAVIFVLWMWVLTKFPVLIILHWGAPLVGITTCIIPCLLVYKVPTLHKLKGASVVFIMFFGILLCLSPFLQVFE